MDLLTVIINSSVSDSPQSGGGGTGDGGTRSASPLPFSFVDLSERSCCQQRVDKHRARRIPPLKDKGTRTGLVIFSQTQPTRRFWPPPP